MRRMKVILGVCVLLAIVAGIAAYSYLSPQMTLKAIADAARSGDTETMNDLIDFQSVKSNLKDDFEAKIAASGKEQSFGGLLASALVPKIIDMVVNPTAVSKLIASSGVAGSNNSQGQAQNMAATPDVTVDGHYAGISRYQVVVQNKNGDANKALTFSLRRQGIFSWRVTKIGYPDDVLASAIASKFPDDSYEIKKKINEVTVLVNPAIVALSTACASGSPQTMNNTSLGLPAPVSIATRYESSIAVGGTLPKPIITMTMNQVGNAISAGQTIVYTGTCTTDGVNWTVSGTVQPQYLPSP